MDTKADTRTCLVLQMAKIICNRCIGGCNWSWGWHRCVGYDFLCKLLSLALCRAEQLWGWRLRAELHPEICILLTIRRFCNFNSSQSATLRTSNFFTLNRAGTTLSGHPSILTAYRSFKRALNKALNSNTVVTSASFENWIKKLWVYIECISDYDS